MFVQAGPVISTIPRQSHPAGSHLPLVLLLPVSVENLEGREPDSISVALDLILCAAVVAAITSSTPPRRSPSDVFSPEFRNE